MKVTAKNATGVLGELLSNMDGKNLSRMRLRMLLASKIEDAMKKCGYNQKQFAAQMGKSTTVISEWLSGDRNFTVDTLADIEDILNIRLLNVDNWTVISTSDENILKINGQPKSKCIDIMSGFEIKWNPVTSSYIECSSLIC